MPSFTATPAVMVIAGGEAQFVPVRLTASPARLVLVGGTALAGPGGITPASVTTPTLDRMARQIPIGEVRNGMVYVTVQEQNRQQRVLEAIEAAFGGVAGQVTDLATLLAQIQATQELAQAASTSAAAVQAQISLESSYTDPVAVLQASNTGTVAIAAHTRRYTDGSAVAVNGGSVTGFAAADYVTVYYDDAARTGGAVIYYGTTSAVAQTGARHVIGSVTIPAVGAVDTTGTSSGAPGTVPTDDGRDYYRDYLV